MYLKYDRDIDSSLKGVFDALEGFVYENDKQIVDVHILKIRDKAHPRLEAELFTTSV